MVAVARASELVSNDSTSSCLYGSVNQEPNAMQSLAAAICTSPTHTLGPPLGAMFWRSLEKKWPKQESGSVSGQGIKARPTSVFAAMISTILDGSVMKIYINQHPGHSMDYCDSR